MFNREDKDTCKSVSTLKQYLDSCPVLKSHAGVVLPTPTLIRNGGRNIISTLDFLRNNWEDNGFIDYIKHPQKMFEDSGRVPSLDAINSVKEDLPKTFNGLWITNKENPRQISYTLENFIQQSKKLTEYQAIIWTNIEPAKLKEMNPLLEAENIIVKSIDDLDTEHTKLLDFVINPKKYIPYNANNYNGVLIDIAKYLIIENQGGILADLNFTFNENFKQLSLKGHDFIAISTGFNRLENGFFVAKAHHIIFRGLLDIIDEMINNPECSLKQLRDTANLENATEFFSMMPLAMAYMKYNNINGNNDGAIYDCSSESTYLPDISKIQQHEKIGAKLENKDFADIVLKESAVLEEYVKSYIKIIIHSPENFNCIEEPIGSDNMSNTWWGTEIA